MEQGRDIFIMKFLEKDLEQIIYEADKHTLSERGLIINGKLLRQIRIGNYGIADLITYKRPQYHTVMNGHIKGEITVYELKQNKINAGAFLQALGYLKGIKSFLAKRGLEYDYNYNIKLIGGEVESSSFMYLGDFFNGSPDFVSINSDSSFSFESLVYKYEVDGISFKEVCGYHLINEGF